MKACPTRRFSIQAETSKSSKVENFPQTVKLARCRVGRVLSLYGLAPASAVLESGPDEGRKRSDGCSALSSFAFSLIHFFLVTKWLSRGAFCGCGSFARGYSILTVATLFDCTPSSDNFSIIDSYVLRPCTLLLCLHLHAWVIRS